MGAATRGVPNLREARQRAAMTQEQLGEAAGVNTITISRLELGQEARLSTIRKLSAALGCKPADLMEGQQ